MYPKYLRTIMQTAHNLKKQQQANQQRTYQYDESKVRRSNVRLW